MKWTLPCHGFLKCHVSQACRSHVRQPLSSLRSFHAWHHICRRTRKKFKDGSIRLIRVKASFYSVLEVDRHASKEDIRKAYRRLARRFHPDVDNTPEAQKRLQAVIAAYNVLSDDLQRERYDTVRAPAPPQSGGDDIAVPGEDAVVVVSLDFLEAALGKQHALEVSVKRMCPDCVGLGAAPGSHPVFCSLCHGRGHVRTKQPTHAGEVVVGSAACPACGATGIVRQEWCTRCGGDGRAQTRVAVNVTIPAGVDAESVLRVKGLGDAGKNRGATGDLYITFAIKPRAGIIRRGLDLYSDVIVRYTDAILGGSAAVATIHGEAQLPIPPGTQDGQVLTLPGAGISPGAAAVGGDARQPGQPLQLASGSRQRGAHHYTVVLLLPSQVSDEERSTLQQLRQLQQSNGSAVDAHAECSSKGWTMGGQPGAGDTNRPEWPAGNSSAVTGDNF